MSKTTSLLLLLPALLAANTVNPPVGKTGAPGETTCASCHAGSAGKGDVVMEFGTLGYQPGVPMKIRIHVWSQSFAYTGMQITARLASNELQQAGHFTAGEFTSVRTQNGLEYVSQNVITGTTVFTVMWTPPATNVGNVRFYVTGVTGENASTASPNAYSATYTMTPGTKDPPSGHRWTPFTATGLTDPYPMGISNDGKVTGTYRILPQNVTGGFIRLANGTVTTFAAPIATDGITPQGINNAGKVVGYYYDSATTKQRGFIRDPDGTFTPFFLPGQDTQLISINDAGLITGTAGGSTFQLTAPPSYAIVDSPASTLQTKAVLTNGTIVQVGTRQFGGVAVLRTGQDTAGFTSCEWGTRGGNLKVSVNDALDYASSCLVNSAGLLATTFGVGAAGTRKVVLYSNALSLSLGTTLSSSGQTFVTSSNSEVQVYQLTPCSIAPTVTTVDAPGAGGAVQVPVSGPADCAANAISDVTWIITANNGATGPATLQVLNNQTGTARTATVWVAGSMITVNQPAAPCQVSANAANASFPAGGGSSFVIVGSSTSCPWTATTDVSWITFTGLTSATGSAPVPFAVAPNNGATVRTGTITVGDRQVTITQSAAAGCTYTVTPSSLSVPATGTTQTFTVTTGAGCTWTLNIPVAWITLSSSTAPIGNGSVTVVVTANTSVDARAATLMIAGQNITVLQSGAAAVTGLRFVPLNPCRLLETRTQYAPAYQTGVYGPPSLNAGTTRTIQLNGFAQCALPANMKAVVFNVTLVPRNGAPADYVTIYPTGETQPDFWTIRSPDGQTVANTAIVKVGSNNSINVFTSSDTDLLIDAFGYFTDSTAISNLAYYPVTPCRVVETRAAYRTPAGPFGPPTFAQGETRRFKFPGNGYCNVPAGATAYSVTLTAVPPAPLAYITTWAAGLTQPIVSNMNSFAGRTLANNLIVPVSSDGSMDVFAYNATDIIIDINGYFAPDNGQGLFYYPVTQCRASDTRGTPFGGLPSPYGGPIMAAGETRSLPIPASTTNCNGIPSNAKAFVVNATALPAGSPMPFLTLWDTGGAQPNASQLNAFEGQTVTNTAIVPAGANGSINAYAYRQTHLVLDISGYFAR